MDVLTNREFVVLKLSALGYANNEIAECIFVSNHTVKVHISSILRKLNARNRTNAVYIATKKKIIG